MSISLQNLRSITAGVTPPSLLPGQLCFNLADQKMFVGDGSDFFTYFDGTQQPAPAGAGWFEVPVGSGGLSTYYLENPANYSPAPTNGQILAYSGTLGKPVWEDASTLGTGSVYVTTNAAVTVAPGVTVSDKISSAIGATPKEADSAIVTGLPGETYQGLYLFTSGNWTFAAGYADPEALQVPYNNAVSGLLATTVQAALDELAATKLPQASNTPQDQDILAWNSGSPVWQAASSVYPDASQVAFDPSSTGLPSFANDVQQALSLTWQLANTANTIATDAQADATAAQTTANIALNNSITAVNTANSAVTTANSALAVANAALPKAGGTMTGDIVFNTGQPVDAGTF